LRDHILGDPGTYVTLSMRRPGGIDSEARAEDYWYFDVELERGRGGGAAAVPTTQGRNFLNTGAQQAEGL